MQPTAERSRVWQARNSPSIPRANIRSRASWWGGNSLPAHRRALSSFLRPYRACRRRAARRRSTTPSPIPSMSTCPMRRMPRSPPPRTLCATHPTQKGRLRLPTCRSKSPQTKYSANSPSTASGRVPTLSTSRCSGRWTSSACTCLADAPTCRATPRRSCSAHSLTWTPGPASAARLPRRRALNPGQESSVLGIALPRSIIPAASKPCWAITT